MIKLSAFIIAKNEEIRIQKAINSLKTVAEEIIVIDSGSTDNTVNISKELGAKVIFNKWEGYVKQKSLGEKICKNNWIINIDADEELSQELQNEIYKIFLSDIPNNIVSFYTKIVILNRNDDKAKFFAPSNTCIRIYNRKYAGFFNNISNTTQDSVILSKGYTKNNTTKLKGPIYHRSGISIEQLVNKANFYSTEQAHDLITSNRIPSKTRMILEFIFFFLKTFFLRRYFVFGIYGFTDSMILSFARFLRLAKAQELDTKRKKSS